MPENQTADAVSHEKRPRDLCAWLNDKLPALSLIGIAALAIYEATMVCIVAVYGQGGAG